MRLVNDGTLPRRYYFPRQACQLLGYEDDYDVYDHNGQLIARNNTSEYIVGVGLPPSGLDLPFWRTIPNAPAAIIDSDEFSQGL